MEHSRRRPDRLGREQPGVCSAPETAKPDFFGLQSPFLDTIGIRAASREPGRVVGEVTLGPGHVNSFGLGGNQGRMYRVRIGEFRTEAEARRFLEALRKDGLNGVILRED